MSFSGILAAIGAAIVAILAAYAKGRRDRAKAERAKQAEQYQSTRERIDHADVEPDAARAREWLRDRKP